LAASQGRAGVGIAVATDVLARFSRIALISVAAVVLTGTIRSFGELAAPSQLWTTTYGQCILVKLGLLCVAALVELRVRGVTRTLDRPTTTATNALATVRNAAAAQLVIAIAILAVAALLVGEAPGRI